MRRREFVRLFAVTAAGMNMSRLRGQSMPVIGFLSGRASGESAAVEGGFRQGLKEAGYIDGQNVQIALRWADGNYARLPELADELIAQRIAVLVSAGGEIVAFAAKAASKKTIPIVFVIGSDPIETGLVSSLNRPDGNITGVTLLAGALGAKRVELLREVAPHARIMAFLVNPEHPRATADIKDTQEAARSLGLDVRIVEARSESELREVFDKLAEQGLRALIVNRDAFFNSRRQRIIEFAAQHSILAIYESREHVVAGGLLSYGPSYTDTYRQAGVYAGRILAGSRPEDLPVVQPSKFELAVNLQTAKALGIEVPPTLLARADEVIE